MTLLLFGGPSPSLANRFGLRRGQILFHFGRCTLQTFAAETAGNGTTFNAERERLAAKLPNWCLLSDHGSGHMTPNPPEKMVGAIGFESSVKRSFNKMQVSG